MTRIEPARPAHAADGTPMSPRYGDVYHSADSGPGQARHVFVGGNALPGRWAARDSFTILETGFGLGVNFLATWETWRRDPARPRRLHFIAIEKHPFLRGDLAALLGAYPEWGELARELVDRWPPPLAGTHRRVFDAGGVALTVVFDDAASALARLEARADAIYLDGFAPSRNPDMWTGEVLRRVARLAAPGATCATWSTARAVRDGLAAAGFALEVRPGFGHKREMLVGRLEPRGADAAQARGRARGERHAIVVGAGLAGAAATHSLTSRGWRITLVDAAPRPAAGASSLHAGCFHPLVARDDSLLARLTRAAFLHALDAWRELERRGHPIAWARCGLLQLSRKAGDEAALHAAIDELGLPATFVEAVDASEGSRRIGWPIDRAGAWFPEGGWAKAPSIVRAQLDEAMASAGSTFLPARRVHALAKTADGWRALAEGGATIAEASVVVLANAADIARLAPLGAPIRSVRGQASYVPASLGADRQRLRASGRRRNDRRRELLRRRVLRSQSDRRGARREPRAPRRARRPGDRGARRGVSRGRRRFPRGRRGPTPRRRAAARRGGARARRGRDPGDGRALRDRRVRLARPHVVGARRRDPRMLGRRRAGAGRDRPRARGRSGPLPAPGRFLRRARRRGGG